MPRPRQKIDQLAACRWPRTSRPLQKRGSRLATRTHARHQTDHGRHRHQQVADDLGRSQATIQIWVNRFRVGGIEGLLNKGKGNGPKSRLTPEMEKAMIAELAKGTWRTARDAWCGRRFESRMIWAV